jgi:hypothetical protein
MTVFCSDVTQPQRVTSATVQNAEFFHVSDPGFIGETEVRFQRVLGVRQPQRVHNWRRSDCVTRSDNFQLSERVQSSRLRMRVISEVKYHRRRGKFINL